MMDSGEGEFSAFHARDLPNAASDGYAATPVGASMLAMVINDDVGCLDARGGLETIASMLVPARGLRRANSERTVGPELQLHRLAPLPTTTPESAGLRALDPDSIVAGSL
jgi:hypothetical protein